MISDALPYLQLEIQLEIFSSSKSSRGLLDNQGEEKKFAPPQDLNPGFPSTIMNVQFAGYSKSIFSVQKGLYFKEGRLGLHLTRKHQHRM